MSRLMTVLVVLLLLAVAGLFLVRHKNASLRASLDKANNVASGQQTIITMLRNQLHVVFTRADRNELAQVALRQELENAAKREAQREKTIARLPNENEDFRRWYGADLSDAVCRLHQCPIYTDTSDHLQRLSESESLPDVGQRPADERRFKCRYPTAWECAGTLCQPDRND